MTSSDRATGYVAPKAAMRSGASSSIVLASLIVCSGPPAVAQFTAMPKTLRLGAHELTLSGQALREKLFINLYGISLYRPAGLTSVNGLRSEDVPKAFRIDVTYDRDRVVTVLDDWTDELVPAIDDERATTLDEAFAGLGEGDRIEIRYLPARGTVVELNERVVARDRGHALMDAYIDVWLGEPPLSEALRASLLPGWPHDRR